ncbi:DJ-1/PfpI family protein [Agrobacterium rosae]|uniref:DJ-1/PfpI family protein n=1 Tax=Agrobacterium rosae TaxID=1972867 RepID=UPI003A80F0DD
MTVRFGFLVFPNVQQLDLTGPYEVFASAKGTQVDLVWKSRDPVMSVTGLGFTPTTTFDECLQFDVLCVPGGGGINALLTDEVVLKFIRTQAKGARYITSVCTGSLVLGAAGLLKGKNAATHWNAMDFLTRFGATPVHERVVRDGNIITAGGVTSGIDFGLSVIAELFGQREAEVVQLSLEYAPAPPFHAGTPQQAAPEIVTEARNRIERSRVEREKILATL